MSATLEQSIAWDRMSPAEKQAATLPQLVDGRHYQVRGAWGTAEVRCLDAETKQFRIINATFTSYGDTVQVGWMVTLSEELLATIKPWTGETAA